MILAELEASTLSSSGDDFSPWAGLAYPAHARAVAAGEFPWLAVCARSRGEPAGLALARLHEGRAELLSVFVAPELRRRGLGAGLLSRLADELARRPGLEGLSVVYSSRISNFEAVERLLPRAGLGTPFARVFYGLGDITKMPAWAEGSGERENGAWRLLSFQKARSLGLEPLENAERAGGPKHLSVRFRESELDWEASHMVFEGDAAKGWFSTHRLPEKPDTLYFTKFWVEPAFAKRHRIAAVLLMTASLNALRTLYRRDGTPRYGAFDTPLEYPEWLRSLGKHLVPHLEETWTHRGLEYALSARRRA